MKLPRNSFTEGRCTGGKPTGISCGKDGASVYDRMSVA